MTPVELMAAALGASVVVATLGWGAASLMERRVGDPGLRERLWRAALVAPLAPPLLTPLALLIPPPAQTVETVQSPALSMTSAPLSAAIPAAEAGWNVQAGLEAMLTHGAMILVGLAGAATAIRLGLLIFRAWRLNRLVGASRPASIRTIAVAQEAARRLGVRPPQVLTHDASEALLCGLARPRLILPTDLDPGAERAVCAHELAHLRRGDHRVVWLDEAILTLLAFNPILPWLRARCAAAREEACDALALAGTGPTERRAYARLLLAALERAGSPPPLALTFTGRARSRSHRRLVAMKRLNAVLAPPARPSRRLHLGAAALIAALGGTALAAPLALAAAREPEIVPSIVAEGGSEDFDWTSAALNPIYRAAWPAACGFGTTGEDDRVFIDTCDGSAVGAPLIDRLAGAAASHPRQAFEAVRAACAAERPVRIDYRQNDEAKTLEVACAYTPEAPPAPVIVTLNLDYPKNFAPDGARLTIWMTARDYDRGGLLSLPFSQDVLPGDPLPRAFSTRLSGGFLPTSADEPLAYEISVTVDAPGQPAPLSGIARSVMVSRDPVSARVSLQPGAATTDPVERSAIEAAEQVAAVIGPRQYETPDAAGLKTMCASADPGDAGFCSGILFNTALAPGVCAPKTADGRLDTATVDREGKRRIAALTPAVGQGPVPFARQALRQAFPCGAARSKEIAVTAP
jgi:beta-lactamase regulating signal transducer with metallopeptidase domain